MKKWLKRTAVVLICLVGLWCILLALRRPWIEPIPGVRLDPTRPILLEKDVKPNSAFDLFRRACEPVNVINHKDLEKATCTLTNTIWSETTLADSFTLVQQFADPLQLARKAAATPDPQVPTFTALTVSTIYDIHDGCAYSEEMRIRQALTLIRLFVISAACKASKGDIEGAYLELDALIAFSSILTRGGTIAQHMVAYRATGVACRMMRQLASRYPVPDHLLEQADRFLAQTESNMEPSAEALRHERLLKRRAIDLFYDDTSRFIEVIYWQNAVYFQHARSFIYALRVFAPFFGSYREGMRKNMDAYYTHCISVAEQAYSFRADDSLVRIVREFRLSGFFRYRDPVGKSLIGMSTQEFGFNVRHVSNVMDIRMTRVSLAIRRFEQKEGRIPRSLGDLSPAYLGAIPCDPFDGKPMRYRVNLDGSWLIYSVGYDGEDNGGVRIVRPGGSVFSSDVVLTADEPPLTMNWVSY